MFSFASFEAYVMVCPFPFNMPPKLDVASGTSEMSMSLHSITVYYYNFVYFR